MPGRYHAAREPRLPEPNPSCLRLQRRPLDRGRNGCWPVDPWRFCGSLLAHTFDGFLLSVAGGIVGGIFFGILGAILETLVKIHDMLAARNRD